MKIPFVNRSTTYSNGQFEINFTDFPVGSNKGYLKDLAVQTVVGHIARSVSVSKFMYTKNGERQHDDIDYMLNVRPNSDQSASEFWQNVVYRLITQNEVLIIFTDDRQMLIADSFTRREFALFPDVFEAVTYKDYTYNRNFLADDVLYMRFSNRNLTTFLDGMFSDYTKLYNNMYVQQLRNNQLRGILKIDSNQAQDERRREATQSLVDKIFKSFSEKAVSIIPLFRGFEYNEISNGSVSTGSSSDLKALSDNIIDELGSLLGVPSGLLHGNVVGLDDQIRSYIKFTIDPINKMLEDELNSKVIGKLDYQNGERIEVLGIRAKDLLDSADAVDKLISSSVVTGNELRPRLGLDKSNDPMLDKHIITKNYTAVENESDLRGGENE